MINMKVVNPQANAANKNKAQANPKTGICKVKDTIADPTPIHPKIIDAIK